MDKAHKTRMVKIGRHTLSLLSARDFMEIGEARWHSISQRTLEMLTDSRAEPAQRVEQMKAVYDLRDRTTTLALQHAATIEGAFDVIEHACQKVKIDPSEDLAAMQPEAVIRAALSLLSVDVDGETDSGNA